MINLGDRMGFEKRLAIQKIRMDQEASFGTIIQRFVEERGIRFEGAARNTKEQNGAAERSGSLLTQKARCLCSGAKLPKDLYPEFYLAAQYLLNRTPTKRFNWKSPLVVLMRALSKPARAKFSHLKVFGCKAYALLKGPDAPAKGDKLMPRAFVGYLIGYDSENIFRIWNPEAWTVRGYRDAIFYEDQGFVKDEGEKPLSEQEQSLAIYPNQAAEPYIPEILDQEWESTPINQKNPPNIVQSESTQTVRQAASAEEGPGNQSGRPVGGLNTPDSTLPRDLGPTEKGVSQTLSQKAMGKQEASSDQTLSKTLDKQFLPSGDTLSGLPETGNTPLGLERPGPSKLVGSADLQPGNVIEGKRARRPTSKFGAFTFRRDSISNEDYEDSEDETGQNYHMAFFAGATHKPPHRDTLPKELTHWRGMLRHEHAEGFKKAADLGYNTMTSMKTWDVVPKQPGHTPLPLMWRFLYKFDENGYFTKYKARVCARGDLQSVSEEEKYAATLAMKRFRALAAMIAAYKLKTRQLDAVNAFLNAKNDKPIYCQCLTVIPSQECGYG